MRMVWIDEEQNVPGGGLSIALRSRSMRRRFLLVSAIISVWSSSLANCRSCVNIHIVMQIGMVLRTIHQLQVPSSSARRRLCTLARSNEHLCDASCRRLSRLFVSSFCKCVSSGCVSTRENSYVGTRHDRARKTHHLRPGLLPKQALPSFQHTRVP